MKCILLTLAFLSNLFILPLAIADESDDYDSPLEPSDSDFTSEVRFTSPSGLAPNTTYLFSFVVTNTSTSDDYHRWITDVELHMPSVDYLVDESSIESPEPLHDGDWEFAYWSTINDKNIHWRNIGYWRIFMGDIREGESLEFSFQAKTDGVPTDGFDWRTVADSYEIATGTAYVGLGDDDLDDDLDDDADDDTDDDLVVDDSGDDSAGADDSEWTPDGDSDLTDGEEDDEEAVDAGDDADSTGASCGC